MREIKFRAWYDLESVLFQVYTMTWGATMEN